jgi:transposase
MGRQPLLDSPKKNRFVGTVLAGKSVRQAAKDHNIRQTTANDIFRKFQETGSTHRRAGSGRCCTITPRMERTVRQYALKNRRIKFADIGKMVTPNISASSVRRILAKYGYHRRKARSVVFLTPAQKAARYQWAKDHKHWGAEDWERVLYSDEAYVVLGDNKGTVYVTRSVDEVFDDECVVPKFKQSSLRIMVWGCIIKGRKGPLVVLEYPGGRGGGMTAVRYQHQVLDEVLHTFYQEMSEEKGQVVFQQDGAPSHTAKRTIAWLDINKVDRMPHPPSSPDMNPIEPLWHILKDIIRARTHIPTTLDELKTAVKEAWDQITVEDVDKLVGSMEDRVQALLKAKGGHTQY